MLCYCRQLGDWSKSLKTIGNGLLWQRRHEQSHWNFCLAKELIRSKVFANGSGCGSTDRVTDQHFCLEELKFIVQEAKKVKGTSVIAHIFDNQTAWDCLEAGVDTFNILNIGL